MAEFTVDTVQLRSRADEIRQLQRNINEVVIKLSGLQLGSVIQIKASTALVGHVSICKWAAIAESSNLGDLAIGLENIAETYEKTEKNLKEPKTVEEGKQKEQEDIWSKILENLIKGLGGINPIASFFSTLYYGCDAKDGGAESIIKALKSFVSAAGSVGKRVVDGASAGSWKDVLLGLSDTAKDMTDTSMLSFLDKELGKYRFSGKGVDGANVTAAAKWAGVILSLASNGIENYEEFHGDFSNLRFWQETITQTGVDVAKGILISAGVATVMVAACGSAPAWAVAAIGGVITVGVDWVCEEVFGEKATELISDFIIDGFNDAAKGFIGIGQRVTEGASAAWNSIIGLGQ